MTGKIFDCHLHVEKGLEEYDLALQNANIIFNTVENYRLYAPRYKEFYHSVIFDYKNNFEFLADCAREKKISAFKIHSRLQKIAAADYSDITKHLRKLDANLPVIYDAFYYNSDLDYQPNLAALVELAVTFPKTNFIVAHAGGYNILQYFFHLRDLRNIGFDLSFSLQYLSDSSCYTDLIKLIKYTPKEKLFFGTDFPSASASLQYNILTTITETLKLADREIEDIFCNSWTRFVNK